MALSEIIGLFYAIRGWVKPAVVAILGLAHEEVTGVDLSVDSDLGVRHIDSKLK